MSEELLSTYEQLHRHVDDSNIESIKNLYRDEFQVLHKPNAYSAALLHRIMAAEKYDILLGIMAAFDAHFQRSDLKPAHKLREAFIRKDFFDQPNADNETLLLLAARNSQTPLVKQLLKNHADVNKTSTDGSFPLREATEEESQEIIEELVAHGANIFQKDTHNHTPFELACRKEKLQIMLTLIKADKAQANIFELPHAPQHSMLPEHSANFVRLVENGQFAAVLVHLDELAARSADRKVEVTPEMLQSTQGNRELFKLLIQYKNGLVPIGTTRDEEFIDADECSQSHCGYTDCTSEVHGNPSNADGVAGMAQDNFLALSPDLF